MSLVDQGVLRLDDPVGQYLREYATPPLSGITLRMCSSHTSGLPNDSFWTTDPSISLRTAARTRP